MRSMQRIVWTSLCAAFLCVPAQSLAGEWEQAITDFEMFENVTSHDAEALNMQREDAAIDDATELFPALEGEGAQEEDELGTHVRIKVDGVPVVLSDVPVFEWFAQYVRDAAERGFVSGYRDTTGRPNGLYGPADSVTIEQIAKMSVLARGTDPFTCSGEVGNASAKGSWSERYILCAEEFGWAVFSDGSVDVLRPATRAEVVVTILQAYGVRISPRSGTLFEDVTTQTEFGAAIETAAQKGIVSGYTDEFGNPTGMFGPEDSVNRAEAAKMFSLAAQVFGE